MPPYTSVVDVHVILYRDGRIALLERRNTGYCDGMLHLPSGHLEEGEALHTAAAREAEEEVGVTIDPGHLALAALVHFRQGPGHARVGAFFLATQWEGEPCNAEPHKAGRLVWADPNMLGPDVIPYPAEGVRAWLEGSGFVPYGWCA
ncbi:NUDIX domain-containing protein [Nocardiopsis algeriensis]|uniref:8-oxo-dGTP pyrophosphatase MutT (NUDIX family) n=1 Tax=Nocardiopsis algeriensis TaxID=1478215 RepID=A0A841IP93_9ACTN|nr:NUDIX domain-containing protein [Nocardiopsis algeriensis]MBB6118088.1 8-oxo-dGTP pyrophosphatase MutT (NUDIX family) [Nocardiopsis algeriensis]